MAISEDALTALQVKHNRIKHVVYNGVDLVFRAPSVEECEQHAMAHEGGPSERVFADRLLGQLLIVHCGDADTPDRARLAYAEILKAYPYAWRSVAIGSAISKLTGVVQDDAVKSAGLLSTPNGAPLTSTPRA